MTSAAGRGAPQQVLSDGIQDLVADVDHDLRIRLQVVVRSGEEIIARSDPAESWSEFETWLRRQVVTAAIGTYDYLADRAAELTERVGQQFQRDADAPSPSPSAHRWRRWRASASGRVRGQGRAGVDHPVRGAAPTAACSLGMAGSLLSVTVAAPVMLVLSLGLGRRAVREERTRRHQQHQAEARALHRYAQEVSLVVGKECKDALRRTQRLLRDEFSARALSLHQSTTAALAQAERARDLNAAEAAERQRQVSQEIGELGRLGAPAGAGGRDAHRDGVGRVDQRPAGTAGQAASTAPDAEAAAAVDEIAGRLSEPLRVAIAGKVKAGKSTLLNAGGRPARAHGRPRVHPRRHLVPRRPHLPGGGPRPRRLVPAVPVPPAGRRAGDRPRHHQRRRPGTAGGGGRRPT